MKREKNKKTPQKAYEPSNQKIPRQQPLVNNNYKILWSFSILDEDGPFGWSQCTSHEKYFEILKKKKEFEKMSFEEIGKNGSHNVEVEKLSLPARKRLEDIHQEDIEQLYSLRLTGKNRIWGKLNNNILRILWWDPEHQVCPSEKKHT